MPINLEQGIKAREREAYSRREFCAAHGIGLSTYYTWPEEKRPKEKRINGRVIITKEAAAAWRSE